MPWPPWEAVVMGGGGHSINTPPPPAPLTPTWPRGFGCSGGVDAKASHSGGATAAGPWHMGGGGAFLQVLQPTQDRAPPETTPPVQQTTSTSAPAPRAAPASHPTGAPLGKKMGKMGLLLFCLRITQHPAHPPRHLYSVAEPCSTRRSRARPPQPRTPIPASPLNAASDFSRLLCVYLFPMRSGVSRL